MQQQEEVDAGDEPHVEQEEKEDTTAADAAAAPAAPTTPADMVFAELHQLFLQQRQQHDETRSFSIYKKRGAAATPAASSGETAAALAAVGARAFSADDAAENEAADTAATEGGGGSVEKERMGPPVEPRPPPVDIRAQLERARVGSSKPKQRRPPPESTGGAGHAQAEPADQEGEGGGLHGGHALAEARGQKRGLPEICCQAGLSSPVRAEKEGCSASPLPSRTRATVTRDLGGNCA
ncbi:unnamed protein product [Ectocarpus sp. CCAP 1310/34]|nr:unnamed protein product [Ectocarpus sp. CCAP 1310/34]